MDHQTIHIILWDVFMGAFFLAGLALCEAKDASTRTAGLFLTFGSMVGAFLAGFTGAVLSLLMLVVSVIRVLGRRFKPQETQACPHCGRQNAVGTTFCPRCDHRLLEKESF